MKRLLVLAACTSALLAAAGCGGKGSTSASPRAENGTAAGIRDLHNIDELRSAFNARQGQPRLILLISPT